MRRLSANKLSTALRAVVMGTFLATAAFGITACGDEDDDVGDEIEEAGDEVEEGADDLND